MKMLFLTVLTILSYINLYASSLPSSDDREAVTPTEWTEVTNDIYLTSKMRCRVVTHNDEVRGKEFEDNNVDRTFSMLQVIRKYSKDLDILVMFGLNGPNGNFGIRRFAFIRNTDPENISDFPDQIWWSEMYETVGPWNVRAVNNPIERSAQNFTGGFHAYIDREKGTHFPSGENIGYSFRVDGREIKEGEEFICEEIECISKERLGAYNTFDPKAGSGRMVMELENRYHIKGDRIYYRSDFKALEDIVIELHYGLQTVSHNPYMYFMSDEGMIRYDTAVNHPDEVVIKGVPHGICGERTDGRCFFARMYETGAFEGIRHNDIKFFGRNYGASNFKQYHYVYGNGNIVQLRFGEGDFYEGYFVFSPKIDGSLFHNNGHLSVEVLKQDLSESDSLIFDVHNHEGYFYDNIYCAVDKMDTGEVIMLRSPLSHIPECSSRRFSLNLRDELGTTQNIGNIKYYRKIGEDYELIQEKSENPEIKKEYVNIVISEGNIQIVNLPELSVVTLYDLNGQMILERRCNDYDNMVDIGGLQSSRIYILKVSTSEFIKVNKFIVR